jgi:hypothetical protein
MKTNIGLPAISWHGTYRGNEQKFRGLLDKQIPVYKQNSGYDQPFLVEL